MYKGDVKVPGTHVRHGQGEYQFRNKQFKYSGSWVDGERHGHGIMELPSGGSYEGTFVHGEIVGNGLRRWGDGTTYSGQFKFGEMQGEGQWVGANGDRYEGSFDSNRRHGQGELQFADGTLYTGMFSHHKFHGMGSITYSHSGGDGLYKAYAGNWTNGNIDGKGEAMYKDESRFEGTWVSGKRQGPGNFFGASGFTYQGMLDKGVPTNRGTKLKYISDDPVDEDALAELPEDEKWKEAAAIEVPREEEDDDEDSEDESNKPPPKPAFKLPEIQIQVLGHEENPCTTEANHAFRLSVMKVEDDELVDGDCLKLYADDDDITVPPTRDFIEARSGSDGKSIVTFKEGIKLGSEEEDGEYVIVIKDANNEKYFHNELIGRYFSTMMYAGISNPRAKKGGGGGKKKKKKKK